MLSALLGFLFQRLDRSPLARSSRQVLGMTPGSERSDGR